MGKRERDSDFITKDKKKKSKKHAVVKKEVKVNDEHQIVGDAAGKSTVAKRQSISSEITSVLVDSEKPVFFRKQVKLSISLLPWSMKDCKQSVENSIRKMMLKYSSGLGGILMAYDDVQLEDRESTNVSQGKGWVLNELPHVHYDVSCNVLVFFPSIGCELKGVVNECFPSHVGILVFGYINAMVSAKTIREAGYQFDVDLQTWTKGGDSITSGVKINFVVTKIHECDGAISLEGDKPARSLLVDSSI